MGDFKLYNRQVGFANNLPYDTKSFVQLTEVGSTESYSCIDFLHHTLQYKVASIDTNVVIRAEGSLDGDNWFNLDANEIDTTQTADGTYAFIFNGKIKYIRFTFVSESGGTDATIDIVYFGGV